MRKRESWMYVGALVLSIGIPSVVLRMQTNKLNGVEYVYYFWLEQDGKEVGPFHPADIEELK